jgi:hypothetical protein
MFLDFHKLPPDRHGYDMVMILVNCFGKRLFLILCHKNIDAKEVAQLYICNRLPHLVYYLISPVYYLRIMYVVLLYYLCYTHIVSPFILLYTPSLCIYTA